MELGATEVAITGKSGFEEPLTGQLDLVIVSYCLPPSHFANYAREQCTADVSEGIPLKEIMSTLNIHGRLIMVAMPDEDLPSLMSSGTYT